MLPAGGASLWRGQALRPEKELLAGGEGENRLAVNTFDLFILKLGFLAINHSRYSLFLRLFQRLLVNLASRFQFRLLAGAIGFAIFTPFLAGGLVPGP